MFNLSAEFTGTVTYLATETRSHGESTVRGESTNAVPLCQNGAG
jgi:hypothetical protein